MLHHYKTRGTCSTDILIKVENGVIEEVSFEGGCNGNLQGICRLIKGQTPAAVIQRLEGIRCGSKTTSCPDQLCRALHEMGY